MAIVSAFAIARTTHVKDRNDHIEETENLEQRQSRERARKVEKDRKDLDPSPNQRTVQPSERTRKSG